MSQLKSVTMKMLVVILVALVFGPVSSMSAQYSDQDVPQWAGTWKGHLENVPARAGAAPVEVMMEIGDFPTSDKTCTTLRSTYSEGGEVRQVKDYKLCRGEGPRDLFVDEGDGIVLTSRLIGDVLVTPFKYDDILLVTTLRLRGDILEEEIITAGDEPAVEGVQTMVARGIQRKVMRRVSTTE